MKPFSTVFQQSYFEKVTSKSFIIITLILILLIILGSNYDYIYKKIFEKEKEITLIAPDKQTYSFLTSLIKKNTDIEKINSYDMSKAKQKLADGTIDYIIEVSNQSNRLKVNVFYNNENKLKDIDTLNLLFNNINVQQIINKYNIENSDVKLLNKENITLKQVGGIKKSDQEIKNFNIFIVVIILSIGFFIVVNYANQIAVDIAKEKSTRVSEIIITSIAPQIHLYAKIFSVIAVALTQIIILFLTIILCNYIFDISSLLDEFNLTYTYKSNRVILIALAFLILALFNFIGLSSLFGSLSSRIENIGTTMMPVTLLCMGSFYIAIFNLTNPDSLLVKITSYIPVLSPLVMILRSISSQTSNFDILLGIIINIITIFIIILFTSKFYKSSLLVFESNIFRHFRQAKKYQ